MKQTHAVELNQFISENDLKGAIETVLDFQIQNFPEVDFENELKKAYSDLIEFKKILSEK